MCDFKPGDEVVCVRMDSRPEMIGKHFTIAAFRPAGDARTGKPAAFDCVQLVEIGYRYDGRRWGFCADRFRKVQRRSSSLSIESLLTIKPGFEEPKRVPARKPERVS